MTATAICRQAALAARLSREQARGPAGRGLILADGHWGGQGSQNNGKGARYRNRAIQTSSRITDGRCARVIPVSHLPALSIFPAYGGRVALLLPRRSAVVAVQAKKQAAKTVPFGISSTVRITSSGSEGSGGGSRQMAKVRATGGTLAEIRGGRPAF